MPRSRSRAPSYLDCAAGTVGPFSGPPIRFLFPAPNDILAGAVTVTGTALVTAYNAGSGAISGNIGGAGMLQIGSGLGAETILLTGSDGATTVVNPSATLQVGTGGAAGALTATTLTDNGSLAFDSTATLGVAANIAGSGHLDQERPGDTLKLAGVLHPWRGATTVSSGVLEVDGSITSDVNVASAGTLTGTGSTGAVTSAGTHFLGTAVSTLITGALTLNAGSVFNVGIAGVNTSSQDNVASGAVTLSTTGAGVALDLSAISYTPSPGDVYTIIANNGGSAINGTFVAGAGIDNFAPGASLPEGADLSDDFMGTGRTATLTYQAGPNHGSVAIEISLGGQFRYAPATGSHNFLLKEVGANFDLYDTTVSATVPVATQAILLTSTIDINIGRADDAALTIDYSGGAFTNKVIFDGGTGSGAALHHTLTLENGVFGTETFSYTGAHAGNVELDGGPVIYSDLSTVSGAATITATASAANVSFILPASEATLQAVSGVSQITTQNASFAQTAFADPSASLTVQTAGSSLVQLGAMDSGFSPASETFTGLASDVFRLTSATHLHSVTSVTLTAATLDLHGDSATLDALNGAGPIINSGALATLTIGAHNDSGSFTGVIQNAINLTKNGSGTQALGAANTYTGATTISAGKVVETVPNALPTGTALSVAGTLDLFGNSQQAASVTGAGTVTDTGGAANFTVNNAAADTFAGSLTGNLALVKTGLGTLTLTHANSYTGSTTISAGTLKQGLASAVPANTVLVVSAGTTLDLFGFALTVSSVTGSGTVTSSSTTAATFTVNDASADAFAGAVTGNLSLSITGAGTLTLSKASIYTGTTTISAGTIADGLFNALPSTTSLTLSGTGTLNLAGFNQQLAGVTGGNTTTVTDSGAAATFTVANAATDTFGGTFAGALTLSKTGAGTLILNGADSYTGLTSIGAGTLQLGNAAALPATDVTDNGTLDLHGFTEIIGALSGSATGAVTSTVTGAITLTIGVTNDSGNFAGAIKNGSGVLSLTKIGSAVQTLGATETYTGATTVSGGTLTVNGSLYSASTTGVVNLTGAGVILSGAGTIHGVVNVQASNFTLQTHIDGVTITVPATLNSVGITVASGAIFAQIGVVKGVSVSGGNTTSTGVLVNASASAMILNSNISGHHIDVNVNGGSAVLQKDILNAGTGAATGLQAENSAIVDAGQIATNATPLPTSQGYAVGNVGLYGDITGLFSGVPLGSSGHSTGDNTFNGYTASTATTILTAGAVAQAIRDLNTGPAGLSAIANVSVETLPFTYGGGFHYGRMDLTAQNNTFDGIASPTSAFIKSLVFDGQRSSTPLGFVVYGVPSMTVSQTNVPSHVAPGAAYSITINYANTSLLPSFGVIYEVVPANETVNLAANPGWVSEGGGLYTFNLGLLNPGATGSVQFNVTVTTKPTVATLTTEAYITADLTSGVVLAPASYVSIMTTVSPNNIRWL